MTSSPLRKLNGRPLRVALITTVARNIGDEFIREGVRSFLDDLLGDYDALYIDKHDLATAHRPLLDELDPPADKIESADLIVQCGAPQFWHLGESSCFNDPWVIALWDRLDKLNGRTPILNLGIGTCQPRQNDIGTLTDTPELAAFAKRVVDACALTTTRDALTAQLLNAFDLGHTHLPCPAYSAARRVMRGRTERVESRDVLAINFMELAGHWLLKAENDPKRWSDVVLKTLAVLRGQYRLLFVAHNESERKFLGYCNAPTEQIFFSPDYRDYLSLYSRVGGIVANRVHAAVCVAGFGRPAVLVGTDSRIATAAELGIPTMDQADVSAEWIIDSFNNQMKNRQRVFDERIALRERGAQDHIRLIKASLKPLVGV